MPVRSWEPGTGDGRGAGVRMDLQHRSALPLSGLDQTVEQVAVGGNSMPHWVPTMFRDLTARGCYEPAASVGRAKVVGGFTFHSGRSSTLRPSDSRRNRFVASAL